MRVLDVEGLSKSYDGEVVFENLSFKVKREDKIAIIGTNGVGKTTLLKILMEEIEADSWNNEVGTNDYLFLLSSEHD